MNLVLLMILGVGLESCTARRRYRSCREPDIERILRNIPNLYDGSLNPSFLSLPRMKAFILRKNKDIPRFYKKNRYFYGGYRTCSEGWKHIWKHGGNLCPSYYLLEHDPDRIPRGLIQTFCACSNCFLRRPTRHLGVNAAVPRLGCRKVYTYKQVARRAGCVDGVWMYRLRWERLSVACTCELINSTNR